MSKLLQGAADKRAAPHILATKPPLRLMTAILYERMTHVLEGISKSAFSRCTGCCSFCQMNEATQITMPYTIAVYMVRDFLGPDASQAHISRLTGILVRDSARPTRQ